MKWTVFCGGQGKQQIDSFTFKNIDFEFAVLVDRHKSVQKGNHRSTGKWTNPLIYI
jgi:hypothetical protein